MATPFDKRKLVILLSVILLSSGPLRLGAETAVEPPVLRPVFVYAAGSDTGASGRAPTISPPLRIGTFNIRMFPCGNNCRCIRSYGFRVCRAADSPGTDLTRLAMEIRKTGTSLLAVNEILNTRRFARFAREKLGPQWRFVYARPGGPQKVGLLYDTSVFEILEKRVFRGLINDLRPEEHPSFCIKYLGNLRPAFACRLRVVGTDFTFLAVVVHLKAGPCGGVRKDQWRTLEKIAGLLARKDSKIAILGDFNDHIGGSGPWDEFCRRTGFRPVTQTAPCTTARKKGCARLDGIFVSPDLANAVVPGSAESGGPCANAPGDDRSAEAYLRLVSDHCPVSVELDPGALRED